MPEKKQYKVTAKLSALVDTWVDAASEDEARSKAYAWKPEDYEGNCEPWGWYDLATDNCDLVNEQFEMCYEFVDYSVEEAKVICVCEDEEETTDEAEKVVNNAKMEG